MFLRMCPQVYIRRCQFSFLDIIKVWKYTDIHLKQNKTNLKTNFIQVDVEFTVTSHPPARWFYFPSTLKMCVCI